MVRHYTIMFNTTKGTRRSIRVNNPDPDLPVEDISAAVDQILDNDVFDPERGGLDSFSRMELTTIDRKDIL